MIDLHKLFLGSRSLISQTDGFLTFITIKAFAKDLASDLFQRNSEEATRMKIQIVRSKHVVISGGRWKNGVVEWLKRRGF